MDSNEVHKLRDQIMTEATRLFVTSGYNGISMREIAEACTVTKAALYYHFKDKESLLMAILIANLDAVDQSIQHCKQAGESTRAQIGAWVNEILAWAPEKRALIRLASQEMVHLSPETRQKFGVLYQRQFTGPLGEILAAGMSRGELRKLEPGMLTWMLMGMLWPFFYTGHNNQEQQTPQAAEMLLDVFFNGVIQ